MPSSPRDRLERLATQLTEGADGFIERTVVRINREGGEISSLKKRMARTREYISECLQEIHRVIRDQMPEHVQQSMRVKMPEAETHATPALEIGRRYQTQLMTDLEIDNAQHKRRFSTYVAGKISAIRRRGEKLLYLATTREIWQHPANVEFNTLRTQNNSAIFDSTVHQGDTRLITNDNRTMRDGNGDMLGSSGDLGDPFL